MKPIALITAEAARAVDEDLPPLIAALNEAGVAHQVVCWDAVDVDWSQFAAVVLRSPWDYVPRLPEFLSWAERVSALTRMLNPLPLIRWNTDKRYLEDLRRAGVATVPGRFVAPADPAAEVITDFLSLSTDTSAPEAFQEFVIKPCIGAGSKDAARYHRDEFSAALTHLQRLLDRGDHVLLQPYLDRVDAEGETALIFIDGQFSHAIRKGPLLHRASAPSAALFRVEDIAPRIPDAVEIALAERALKSLADDPRFASASPLLYARVDLLRLPDGSPCVLELETTEPSLFFAHAPGSAARFVQALRKRIG